MPDTPEPAAILRAPWTPEQVHALNAYQSGSGMHPFTCGRDHGGQAVALIAHTDGWHCSEPPCDYQQDWALAFMADPSTWPGTRRLHGLLEHVGIAQPSPETPAPVPGPDPTLQDRVAEAPGPAPAAAGTLGPLWTAMASAIAALPVPPPPHPDRDRRDRVAAALLARIKQATVSGPQPFGADPLSRALAANEYDLADTVLAELAPELARAEQAEAALARVRAVAERWERDAPPPGNRPLTELRIALDGPCADPYTDADGHTWHCERTLSHDGPHRAAPDAEHHREWPARPAGGAR